MTELSLLYLGGGIQFKPLRIKGAAIKKDVVICHTLALDYDIDQLGN